MDTSPFLFAQKLKMCWSILGINIITSVHFILVFTYFLERVCFFYASGPVSTFVFFLSKIHTEYEFYSPGCEGAGVL